MIKFLQWIVAVSLMLVITGCERAWFPPSAQSGYKIIQIPVVAIPRNQRIEPPAVLVPPQIFMRTPPQALMTLQPEPNRPQFFKAHFTLVLPKPEPRGFSTQALQFNNINAVKLEITGIGIPVPLQADGANAQGLVPNPGGTVNLTVSNIPVGKARIVTLKAYDATPTEILGTTVKTVFDGTPPVTTTEVAFRYTAAAQVVEAMMGTTANNHLVSQMDTTALKTWMDGMTGVAGTFPNYTYTTHPMLINAAPIATDLLANNGNVGALNPANAAYKGNWGRVQFSLSGLIGPDVASVTVIDPWSATVINLANGGPYLIDNVLPGSWLVLATSPTYAADTTPTAIVTAGNTTDVGTINLSVAAVPNITSLSAPNGIIGSALTINGTNFHNTVAGNTVKFGTVTTALTSATTTQLQGVVPGGIFGNQSITVTVGGQVSNAVGFDVTPTITSLVPASKAIGTTIDINGSGFDSVTPANNIVKFNGINATVNTASNSLLNVTVPTAANGNVTVQVGTQTSNGVAFNVLPTITLTAPVGGSVVNGTVPVSATVTSGNPVTHVEFFEGVTSIGVDTTFPYSVNWNTTVVASGAHTLTAKVTDGVANQVTSSGVNVTVNQLPTITSLVASQNPIPGVSHPIRLTVTASDVDNTLNNASYTWSCDGGCGSFNRTDSPVVIWTAPAVAGGPYTLRVAVSDGVNPPVESTLNLVLTNFNANVNFTGGQK